LHGWAVRGVYLITQIGFKLLDLLSVVLNLFVFVGGVEFLRCFGLRELLANCSLKLSEDTLLGLDFLFVVIFTDYKGSSLPLRDLFL